MCPEMTQKKRYFPEEADLYACGVILFSIVCKFPPFAITLQDEKYWSHVQEVYSSANDSPTMFFEFKDLVLRMLAT